jgi:hypothetical protein
MKPQPQFSTTPAMPNSNDFSAPIRRTAALALLLLAFAAQSARAAETRPPALDFQLISNSEGLWPSGTTLAFRIEVRHPLEADDTDTTPWLLNPGSGWASAFSLIVKSSDGQVLPWTFKRSATRSTAPLSLEASAVALVGFSWDPAAGANAVPPGRYEIRARLAAADGTGWRGHLESEPIVIERQGPISPLVHLDQPVPGSVYRGWPWGARVWIESPADALRFPIPGGMGGWASVVALELKNAAGVTVASPLLTPRQFPDSRVYLEPGTTTDKLFFRLPAGASSNLSSGAYRLVAKFTRLPGAPGELEWSGTAESPPLEITVADPPAFLTPELFRQQALLEIGDGLAEGQDLRIEAGDKTIGVPRQIETIRRAAAPLLRAEQAASRLMARFPDDPAPALLLAAILRDQYDKERAADYSRIAEGLVAALPHPGPEPGTEFTEPIPPDAWIDFPELFLRQSIEVLPEIPDPLLTPELRLMIAVTRGDGPEPTTFAEQDRYFPLDPNGQWAATAFASSEYRLTDYSAARATGAPDVTRYGDSPLSWASRLADSGYEWLELTFSNAVPGVAVRVRQNYNPGAISKVELFDTSGAAVSVYSGPDTNTYPANQLSWFIARFTRTAQPVQRVRLTLDSARVRGWNEIDAVQLVTGPGVRLPAPELAYSIPAGSGSMVIAAWPSGFALQRASRLAPADWSFVTNPPPLTILLSERAEFFRLVSVP